MRKRKLSALLFVFGSMLTLPISAQTGFSTGLNGSVVNLPCNVNCLNVPLQVPHIKGTGDYIVNAIPYKPFGYTSPTGTEVTSIYTDDRYSNVITMPFKFCFYDTVFSEVVIGSNGIITFDKANAACVNSYSTLEQLPYSGGTICTQDIVYYPKASIMAAYSDLDLRLQASPADRRIEWRVEGVAPFRRFIVSYYHIGVFGAPCTTPNTFQVVLYETSGVIDIYVEQKACQSSSSNGRAIMGLQNWNRDKAVTAPGKNSTVWAEKNTAYRFIPSANGPSRFVISELYDINNVFIARGDTSTTTAGLLDIKFPTVCPAAASSQYIIKTSFSACDNPANETSVDTFTVNKTNSLNATVAVTTTACGLTGSGTATVTLPAGLGTAPYTFTLNPGNVVKTSPIAGNVLFNGLTAGNYTMNVTDAANTCSSPLNFTIVSTGVLNVTLTSTNTSCFGASNGRIEIDPPNGTPPLSYSIDGTNFVATNIFTNLAAAAYKITVRDAAGCEARDLPATIAAGPRITMTTTANPTSCPGLNNGSIQVTGSTGTAPYTYSINGGAYTGNSTFTGLAPGAYLLTLRDNVGCVTDFHQQNVVAGNSTLTGTATPRATSCSGVNDGSISVVPTSGSGPYEYSINNGTNWQAANTFNGLAPGNYSIVIREGGTCLSNGIPAVVVAGAQMSGTITGRSTTCTGLNNGSIEVTPGPAATGPFEYSINNGTNWQASNIFNGLGPGNYNAIFRNAGGCVSAPLNIIITSPAALSAPVPLITHAICNGSNTGKIITSPIGGTYPYSYSLNNINFQPDSIFNVGAGTYTVYIRDANNCNIQINNITVNQPAALNATINGTADATCSGGADGNIQVGATGGTAPYQYSIDGTNFQTANQLNVKNGTYNVTVKDINNCTFTIPNVAVGLTDNLTLAVNNPAPVCQGTGSQLVATSNATAYSWTELNGITAISTISNPVFSPAATTTYTVTATLGNCIRTMNVQVPILPAPIANAGQGADICFGQNAQLHGTGGLTYVWSPATYLDDITSADPQVIKPAKTTTYSLTVTDNNNCTSLQPASVTVNVTPPIKVTVSPADTVVYTGVQFQFIATSAATAYTWSPANNLINPNSATPIVTAGQTGTETTYTVVGSTPAGCEGVGTAVVRVYKGPDIYVPNAFTPDGDGNNDTFYPYPVGIKKINYFRVFNRWGQLLFATTTLRKGWDGKLGGSEQQSGVYIWTFQGLGPDNQVINRTGTVTLIR